MATTDASILKGLKVATASTSRGPRRPPLRCRRGRPAESLRYCRTVSVLFGIDNQFSGKLIKESSGQTADGLPLNLRRDDLRRRVRPHGPLQGGHRYRTTPRTEGVFNFVLSRSSADPVNVGTVGQSDGGHAGSVVQFDDLDYWGIEGGRGGSSPASA